MNELKGNDKSVSLYPNPATNAFYLDMSEHDAAVSIYNLSGMKLISKQTMNRNYFDISTLPQGMYIVRIITSEGSVEKKLMKN